jgi:hypothetical protein
MQRWSRQRTWHSTGGGGSASGGNSSGEGGASAVVVVAWRGARWSQGVWHVACVATTLCRCSCCDRVPVTSSTVHPPTSGTRSADCPRHTGSIARHTVTTLVLSTHAARALLSHPPDEQRLQGHDAGGEQEGHQLLRQPVEHGAVLVQPVHLSGLVCQQRAAAAAAQRRRRRSAGVRGGARASAAPLQQGCDARSVAGGRCSKITD